MPESPKTRVDLPSVGMRAVDEIKLREIKVEILYDRKRQELAVVK